MVVQKTAKKIKLQKIIGRTLMCLGFIFALTFLDIGIALGAVLLLVGATLEAVARFSAWWHHG